ncbi:hypothetical protein [Mesoplasma seiffertii]|uniref:hypothetical protein n=1 Tax=Mesoplasma seiffertii TaxID=28224 RepID=UPI000478E76C|nr:hypothetical protein [Mesoplasma seiffertii]
MEKCSKCSVDSKGLTTIAVGTEDLYVKTTMLVCWKCFRKEFNKHENKNVFVFKRELPKANAKKLDSSNVKEKNKKVDVSTKEIVKEKNKKVKAEIKVNVEKETKAEQKAKAKELEKKAKAEKKSKSEKKFKVGKKSKVKKPEVIEVNSDSNN